MPEINPQRLMNDLKHLRTIGKYGTGVVRPAFSAKNMEARQWLLDRMRQADLEATMDGVGNVFGQSLHPGKSVLIGSHTDTHNPGGYGSMDPLASFTDWKLRAHSRKTGAQLIWLWTWHHGVMRKAPIWACWAVDPLAIRLARTTSKRPKTVFPRIEPAAMNEKVQECLATVAETLLRQAYPA